VVEKRPRRDAVQKDDGVSLAYVGVCHLQLKRPSPPSVMRFCRARNTSCGLLIDRG
jgi:hypothetical protein